MTLTEGIRVVIGTNGYDANDASDPLVFQGHTGIISEIKDNLQQEVIYYVFFDDPRINVAFDEEPDVAWPFYAKELEPIDV